MLPPIPTELYEAIIDQADYETLNNCALVCRAFRPRCQKLLFSQRITLTTTATQSKPRTERLFADLIERHPHLCALIQALEVTGDAALPTNPYLAVILQKLPNLKVLAIIGHGDWLLLKFLSPELRDALFAKFLSPKFTTLELRNVRAIPLSYLQRVRSLRSLTLDRCRLSKDDANQMVHCPPPSICFLRLSQWRSIVEWLAFVQWVRRGATDLTQLKTLKLEIEAVDLQSPQASQGVKELEWFTEQCSASLESLDLLCPDIAVWAGYKLLDLSSVPRLRSVSLQGCIWTTNKPDTARPGDLLQWHTTMLNGKTRTNLERVSLLYHIDDDASIESSVFVNDADMNWSGFVAAIQALRESTASLSVTLHIRNARGPFVHDVLQEKLAALKPLGVLTIEQTIAEP